MGGYAFWTSNYSIHYACCVYYTDINLGNGTGDIPSVGCYEQCDGGGESMKIPKAGGYTKKMKAEKKANSDPMQRVVVSGE